MKYLISVLFLAMSQIAFAEPSELSTKQMAEFLINPKIAACVAQLQKESKSFQVFFSDSVAGETIGKGADKARQSEINYRLIQGGDIIAGIATITINEKFYAQFGFPSNDPVVPVVDSCSVSVKK